MPDRIEAGPPVRLGHRPVGPPVRTGWDAPTGPGGAITRLDDLADVDAPPADVGVLTRAAPGGNATFEPLPDPPPVPQRFEQAVPAARWQIVHNLGYRPGFVVHTLDGLLHMPENIEHPVPGSISEITFGAPVAGYADPP